MRDWAVPKPFTGLNTLLPSNRGDSLQQQLKATQGSCQHFVFLLQRSVSEKAGLPSTKSHSPVQHQLSSPYKLVLQTHSHPKISRYLLFHPDRPSKNWSTDRNGRLQAGDVDSRPLMQEPLLLFGLSLQKGSFQPCYLCISRKTFLCLRPRVITGVIY